MLAVRKESERLKRIAAPLIDRFGSSALDNTLICNINMHSPFLLLFFLRFLRFFFRVLCSYLMLGFGFSERAKVSELV